MLSKRKKKIEEKFDLPSMDEMVKEALKDLREDNTSPVTKLFE